MTFAETTFAETLNQNDCSCGVEDGVYFFLSEGGAKSPTEVGDYRLAASSSCPPPWCWSVTETQWGLVGFEKNTDKRVCAVYDAQTRLWVDLN